MSGAMVPSVSYPVGAHVGFCLLTPSDPREWSSAYNKLIADIRRQIRSLLPNFESHVAWRGCSDRVLARNPYADIGLSVAHGMAAVWMAEREDSTFRARTSWGDLRGEARDWMTRIGPRFDEMLMRLGCIQHLPADDPAILWPLAA